LWKAVPVLEALLTFVPVAAVLCLTPGPATALVVRSALRGGWPEAMRVTAGNSVGIVVWATAAALGVAAVVAASSEAFLALKVIGAGYLVILGVQSWRRSRRTQEPMILPPPGSALRDGLITSLANPKLAIFFVALLPSLVPSGAAILPSALTFAGLLVLCDVIWFSVLALAVARARQTFVDGPWARWTEQVTGTVLIALGLRLATTTR